MKFIMYFLLLFALMSCNKEKTEINTTQLDIIFNVEYNEEPVVLLSPYNYIDNQKLLFQKVDFYLSNISLSQSTMIEKTELKTIDFLDLTSSLSTIESSIEGYKLNIPNIPVGDYSGLNFYLGVEPNLNTTIPSDYSSSHPLGRTDHFWGAWNTYIFAKLEGKLDSNNDGVFDTPFSYHIGTDVMGKNINLSKPFELKPEKDASLNITFDLQNVFTHGGESMNIKEHPTTHNPIDSVYGQFISEGFKNAFSIE